MATTLVWTCPIDGLSIKTVVATEKGNASDDPHVHLIIEDSATCANVLTPHKWKFKADIVVERVN